jgi:nitrogen-specific signal transduction histidine kinase
MSTAEEISLLGHLHTPILVGDPDGFVVYANRNFRERFCSLDEDPVGQPLAQVFDGGAREVVLTSTAEVLQRGKAARLKIREGGHSYIGVCSPIEAEDDRVGVVMVMLEEHSIEEHLTGLADEVGEPIADALQAIHGLSSYLDGKLREPQKSLLERGLTSMENAQRWMRKLSGALRGGKVQQGRFDVANAVLRVTERLQQDCASGLDLQVLMPPNLPRVAGTTVVFERLLSQLVRQRVDEAKSSSPVTLLARTMGGDQPKGVLISVVDVPDPDRRDGTGLPPESFQEDLLQMGGEAICFEDSRIGRVTSMRLSMARA